MKLVELSHLYSLTRVCICCLQDGPDTVCHGVDILNTETQEVTTSICFLFFSLKYFFAFLPGETICNLWIHLVPSPPFELVGSTVYFKGDLACIRRGWTYLSINYKSTGTYTFSICNFPSTAVCFMYRSFGGISAHTRTHRYMYLQSITNIISSTMETDHCPSIGFNLSNFIISSKLLKIWICDGSASFSWCESLCIYCIFFKLIINNFA